MLGPSAAFLIGASANHEERRRSSLIVLLGGAALVFFALTQYADGGRPGHERFHMQFGSANVTATVMGALACMAAVAGVRDLLAKGERAKRAKAKGPIALTVCALCLGAVLASGSRAGVAATLVGIAAVGLGFAAIAWGRRLPQRRRMALGLATLGLVGLSTALMVVLIELIAHDDPSLALRKVMVETHWQAFLERPLTGHGLNTFHELNTLLATVNSWDAVRSIGSAHNLFVQMLEENGLIGASLMALVVAAAAWAPVRRFILREKGWDTALAALAAFTVALSHAIYDFGLQVPAVAALLFYQLGLANAGSGAVESPPARSTKPATGR
jgi:O-antigen ligase